MPQHEFQEKFPDKMMEIWTNQEEDLANIGADYKKFWKHCKEQCEKLLERLREREKIEEKNKINEINTKEIDTATVENESERMLVNVVTKQLNTDRVENESESEHKINYMMNDDEVHMHELVVWNGFVLMGDSLIRVYLSENFSSYNMTTHGAKRLMGSDPVSYTHLTLPTIYSV